MNFDQLLFTSNSRNDVKFFIKLLTNEHITQHYKNFSFLAKVFEKMKKSYNMSLISFLYNIKYGESKLFSYMEFKLITNQYFLSNSELKLNLSCKDYEHIIIEYNNSTPRLIHNSIFNNISKIIIGQILDEAHFVKNNIKDYDTCKFNFNNENFIYFLKCILHEKIIVLLLQNNICNIEQFSKITKNQLYDLGIYKNYDIATILHYSNLFK